MAEPAFTDDEIITVFQVINKPAADFFTLTDEMGTAMYGLDFSGGNPGDSLQTIFNTIVAAMQAKADAYKIRIRKLICEWLKVDLKTVEIKNGSVGDITGLEFAYENKRKEIRRQMVNLIPFLDQYDALEKRTQGNSGNPLQVKRMR